MSVFGKSSGQRIDAGLNSCRLLEWKRFVFFATGCCTALGQTVVHELLSEIVECISCRNLENVTVFYYVGDDNLNNVTIAAVYLDVISRVDGDCVGHGLLSPSDLDGHSVSGSGA